MAGKKDISAGRAYVELFVKQNALSRGLNAAGKRMRAWGRSAIMTGGAIAGAGAALLAPITAAVNHFAQAGDALDKMAARTGVAVSSLSELSFAMEQSGGDAETLEKGLFGLSRSYFDLARGGAASKDAFGELGISMADLAKRNPEEQLMLVADQLSRVEDMSKRGAIAQQIFGRSGRQMLPMLAEGAAGIEKLREQARGLGLTKTGEQAKQAAAVVDAINRVKTAITATVFEIGSAMAPTVLRALEVFQTIAVEAGKWMKANKSLVVTLAAVGVGLVAVGGVVAALGVSSIVLGAGLTAIATILGFIGTALTALVSPAGLVVAALVAAVVAWAKFTKSGQAVMAQLRKTFGAMLDTARQTIGGIVDAISGGDLALAGQIALSGLTVALLQGFQGISSIFGSEWKKIIDGIGGAIMQGDMAKAWEIAVKQLAKVWADFSAWVVGAAVSASKKVVEVWATAVSGLAKSMLETASKDGIAGRVMSKILGVDMKAEKERAEKLNKQLGIKEDPMAAAFGDVDRQLEGIKASADGFLDDLVISFETAAEAAGEAAASAAGPGAEAFSKALEIERDRLKALTDKAKKEAEKRREELATAAETGAGADGALAVSANTAAGTFSATALQRLAGGGGGPVERMANDIAAIKKATVEQKQDIEAIRRKGGPAFG